VIEFLRDALGIFAAVAPFGVLPVFLTYQRRDDVTDPRLLYAAAPVALVLLAAAALVSEPFLDLIDVSGTTFQLAAAVFMVPLAARLVLTGTSIPLPRPLDDVPPFAWLYPLAFPLLSGPTSIVAAISYAARYGEARTIAAAAVVLAATAGLAWAGPRLKALISATGIAALGHASGLLLLAIAFEHAIDGIRSI